MLDQLLDLGLAESEPLLHSEPEALDLAEDRHEALRSDREPDAGVPERGEVGDGELHRGPVVGGDEGGLHLLGEPVDQDVRDALPAELVVAAHVGRGVGVQAGDEDDAGDPAVDQHLGQLVLGGPAGRLRGQHRRVPLPGQGLADDLGERREDRVVQFRSYQTDEPRTALAQLHGPLVAEYVEGGQHGFAGACGHTGLAVEHAADCGFADPRLGCDVG